MPAYENTHEELLTGSVYDRNVSTKSLVQPSLLWVRSGQIVVSTSSKQSVVHSKSVVVLQPNLVKKEVTITRKTKNDVADLIKFDNAVLSMFDEFYRPHTFTSTAEHQTTTSVNSELADSLLDFAHASESSAISMNVKRIRLLLVLLLLAERGLLFMAPSRTSYDAVD